MAYLNSVQLIGNVGNDPEVRYLDQDNNGNAKVASFRLATTERYKDRNGEPQSKTDWHSIVGWNKQADFIEKYVKKGANLFVSGKLKNRQWTDQSGNKRQTTEVAVENIQILDKRTAAQGAPASAQTEEEDLPFD